jgi:hypothetical protein
VPKAIPHKKIIFLHIAKTAGTSVVEFFRERFTPAEIISHGDFMQYCHSEPIPAQIIERCRFVSGHFGYSQVADYLDKTYSFTFLRDPLDRILSFYRFCMNEDMQQNFAVARAARDLGLEGFMRSDLPEVVEMLDNQQTWQLARMYWTEDREALSHLTPDQLLDMAKDHLLNLSYVGLTETFDEDLQHILRDLKLDDSARIPRVLRTPRPVRLEELSAVTIKQLRSRMALDMQLYEFVRASRAQPA